MENLLPIIVNHFAHFEKSFLRCFRKKSRVFRTGRSRNAIPRRAAAQHRVHSGRVTGETPHVHSAHPAAAASGMKIRVLLSAEAMPPTNSAAAAARQRTSSPGSAGTPAPSRSPARASQTRPSAAPSRINVPASISCADADSSISAAAGRRSPFPRRIPRRAARSRDRRP